MGSIFLTHPSLPDYTASRADLLNTSSDLFAMVMTGKVTIELSHTYALKDAPQAHADLEARKTTGSIVLIP
jgi:NADPH2:quinone reductase